MRSLCDLPAEVLVAIFEDLGGYELARLERVSKVVRHVVRRHQKRLWLGKMLRGLSVHSPFEGRDILGYIRTKQHGDDKDDRLLIHGHFDGSEMEQWEGKEKQRIFAQVLKVTPMIYRQDVRLTVFGPFPSPPFHRCLFDLIADRLGSLRHLEAFYPRRDSDVATDIYHASDLTEDSEDVPRPFPSILEHLSLGGRDLQWNLILRHPRLRCNLSALKKVELKDVPYQQLQEGSTVQDFLRSIGDSLEELILIIDCHSQPLNDATTRLATTIFLPRLQKLSFQRTSSAGQKLERFRPLGLDCPNVREVRLEKVHLLDFSDLLHDSLETLFIALHAEDEWLHRLAKEEKLSGLFAHCTRLRSVTLDCIRATASPITVAVLRALAKAAEIPVEEVRISRAHPLVMTSIIALVQSRLSAVNSIDGNSTSIISASDGADQQKGTLCTPLKVVHFESAYFNPYKRLSDDLRWLEKHVTLYSPSDLGMRHLRTYRQF